MQELFSLKARQDTCNDVVQSVVEEDYTIQCGASGTITDSGDDSGDLNFTIYTTSLTATYTQNFDFTGKFCLTN